MRRLARVLRARPRWPWARAARSRSSACSAALSGDAVRRHRRARPEEQRARPERVPRHRQRREAHGLRRPRAGEPRAWVNLRPRLPEALDFPSLDRRIATAEGELVALTQGWCASRRSIRRATPTSPVPASRRAPGRARASRSNTCAPSAPPATATASPSQRGRAPRRAGRARRLRAFQRPPRRGRGRHRAGPSTRSAASCATAASTAAAPAT